MNGFISIKESDCEKIIKFLTLLKEEKNQIGAKTPNLDSLIPRLSKNYEEQRMMTEDENDEMVNWSVENFDD